MRINIILEIIFICAHGMFFKRGSAAITEMFFSYMCLRLGIIGRLNQLPITIDLIAIFSSDVEDFKNNIQDSIADFSLVFPQLNPENMWKSPDEQKSLHSFSGKADSTTIIYPQTLATPTNYQPPIPASAAVTSHVHSNGFSTTQALANLKGTSSHPTDQDKFWIFLIGDAPTKATHQYYTSHLSVLLNEIKLPLIINLQKNSNTDKWLNMYHKTKNQKMSVFKGHDGGLSHLLTADPQDKINLIIGSLSHNGYNSIYSNPTFYEKHHVEHMLARLLPEQKVFTISICKAESGRLKKLDESIITGLPPLIK